MQQSQLKIYFTHLTEVLFKAFNFNLEKEFANSQYNSEILRIIELLKQSKTPISDFQMYSSTLRKYPIVAEIVESNNKKEKQLTNILLLFIQDMRPDVMSVTMNHESLVDYGYDKNKEIENSWDDF